MAILFVIFALDWLIFKMIFNFGRSVFEGQRSFLVNNYMVNAPYHVYDEQKGEYIPDSNVIVYVDAFEYDRALHDLKTYAKSVKLRELPWFDGLVATDNAHTISERAEEDFEWTKVKETLPSYYDMTQDVRKEMKAIQWLDKCLPWSYKYLCYLVPTQLMLSPSGREHWRRVCRTYFGMLLVCVGIWPQWLVDEFEIVKKFENFIKLSEVVYREVGNEVFSSKKEDTFTKIENDVKESFGQFIASIILCRIALLQIVPSLTVISNFASAVASTPLFVLSETMNERLPPLIFTKSLKIAEEMLEADTSTSPSRARVWFFAYFMFINHSRLIQFFINGYQSVVSISIIFFPQYLGKLVPLLVAILFHQGLLSAFYVVLLFKKLLFRNTSDGTAKMQRNLDDDDEF